MLQFTSYVDEDGALTAIGDRVVADHLPLANKLAHHFARQHDLEFDDLSGAAYLGLVRAARGFDPTRGCTFGTYARHWVLCFLREEVRRARSVVRKPRPIKGAKEPAPKADISLDAPLSEGSDATRVDLIAETAPSHETNLVDADETALRREALHNALATLTERERAIVKARHGDDDPLTLAELAGRFSVSVERIRQIETAALEKITRRVRDAARKPGQLSRYERKIGGLTWARDPNDNTSRRAVSCAFSLPPTTSAAFDARMGARA